MFITTSRKADISLKRICKFLSVFFSDIKHIPRGKTELKKIFEKSSYLGYKYFLIVSKKEEEIFLEIYNLKEEGYFLDCTYKIKDFVFDLTIPQSRIKKIQKTEKPEFRDLFNNKETDSSITIEKKDKFYFLLDGIKTGFSFALKKV